MYETDRTEAIEKIRKLQAEIATVVPPFAPPRLLMALRRANMNLADAEAYLVIERALGGASDP